LIDATWKDSQENGYRPEIGRAADQALLYHLMSLAANNEAAPQVRTVAESKLRELMAWLKSNLGRTQKSDEPQGCISSSRSRPSHGSWRTRQGPN